MSETTPVPFNHPTLTGAEEAYVLEAVNMNKVGPGGRFVAACQDWLTERFAAPLVLPTGSCTAALEISAILLGLGPGDEVILPSFAYPSTATAFARVGATLVFVDVEPGTMNVAPDAIDAAITERTGAIVVLHYSGLPCDMSHIQRIADAHGIPIVEDAALAFLSRSDDRLCGTFGTLGCFSFHETKTVHCGQGGALVVNDAAYTARAETIFEKGTDRRQFLRGEVDRYTWQDIGSAYALENLRAAFLFGQLEHSESITRDRVARWNEYQAGLADLAKSGAIEIASVPENATGNGHIFWIKTADAHERDALTAHLARSDIRAIFHYVPLHSAVAGRKYGRFHGEDVYTTRDADRLLRLPIFYNFDQVPRVVEAVNRFYR